MKKPTGNKSDAARKLTAKRGRPCGSSGIRVVPVFHSEIDVQKLGRAALRLAMLSAEGGENETQH